MLCSDGVPVEAHCDACALLSCGSACCGGVAAFTAYGDPFALEPSLLQSFTASGTGASITAQFVGDGSAQIGAVTFALDQAYPLQADNVTFTFDGAATAGIGADYDITLENGDDGCAYFPIGSNVDGYTLLIPAKRCWGAADPYTGPSGVQQINVRVLVPGSAAGSATLTVRSLELDGLN